MRNPIRWIPIFALFLGATAIMPQTAHAANCASQYAVCLSEAGMLKEPFRTMADIECGAEYAGCVARKLLL